MPVGEGKYDDLTTYAREKAAARGCILMIIDGNKGSGFSVQAPMDLQKGLPELLRHVAAQIEETIEKGGLDDHDNRSM